MPSHLRDQASFAPFSAHITASSYPHTTSPPPAKRQRKMTVTQTYHLVHSARGKLTREAQRSEHDLRLLVGHANLLDSLMLDLEQAEEEQQQWFNTSVRQDNRSWAATTNVEELELDSDMLDGSDDEVDSDSDFFDQDVKMVSVRPQAQVHFRPQPIVVHESQDDDEEAMTDSDSEADEEEDDISDDEDADNLGLALHRTRSHTEMHVSHPPELVSDSDDSDDEASSPPSPPQAALDYSSVNQKSNFTLIKGVKPQPHQVAQDALYEDGFYIPNNHQSTMIAAC